MILICVCVSDIERKLAISGVSYEQHDSIQCFDKYIYGIIQNFKTWLTKVWQNGLKLQARVLCFRMSNALVCGCNDVQGARLGVAVEDLRWGQESGGVAGRRKGKEAEEVVNF